MKNISVHAGEGRYQISIEATLTGDGINLIVTGGERPHIGAVVVSIPLKDEGQCTVIPIGHHRDDEVAKPVAEMVCRAFNQVVVVTAGIHIDAAEKWEIDLLVGNTMEAAHLLIEQIGSII